MLTVTGTVQETSPSVTVTTPVGVPRVAVTVKLTVTGCPKSDGSGVSAVMAVVVSIVPLSLSTRMYPLCGWSGSTPPSPCQVA